MKILIILSALVALSCAKVIVPLNGNLSPVNEGLSCNYVMMGSQYTCQLSIDNPQGFDNFTSISGTHLEGRTNDDVTFIYAMNQTSRNVPRIFCQTFPNLLDFLLEESRVELLSVEAFADCRNIEFIILGYNNIRTIPDRVFANNERLEYVFLQRNAISTIARSAFDGNTKISMLDLSFNQLSTYSTAWFHPIANTLTHLYLDHNRFEILPSYAFSELENLIELDIGNNPFISIPSTVFYNLMSLERLALDSTGIRDLDPAMFSTNFNLTQIMLQFNMIRELHPNTFNNLNRLSEINLHRNLLTFINRDAFGSALNSLLLLNLERNNIEAFDETIINQGHLLQLLLNENRCFNGNFYNVPNDLELVRNSLNSCFVNFIGSISCEFIQLNAESYWCFLSINNVVGRDFEEISGDHLSDRNNEDVTVLEAIAQNTRTIPAVICRSYSNLEDIWIEMSSVEIVNEESFAGCGNLMSVILNINMVTVIPDNTFRNNPNLHLFHAILNGIREIGNNAFTGSSLREINLEDNFLPSYNPAAFASIGDTLLELNLAYNRINSLPQRAFESLRALDFLIFSDNRVGRIPSNAFQGLRNLSHWEFENCDLPLVDPAWFSDSPRLSDIRLSGNQIRSLPAGTFDNLNNLLVVTITDNRIRNINSNAFGSSLDSLILFYGENNGIRSFDDEIINRGNRLSTLRLNNNFCVNSNFFNLQENVEEARQALQECFRMFSGFLECSYVRVRNDYICHLTLQNPQPRNDFYFIGGSHMEGMVNDNVTILDAMRQDSAIIPSIICRQFPNLRDLYIDESQVEVINEDAFEHCTNLRWLDLYGNFITSVPDFTFANNPLLSDLHLLYNHIDHIAPNAFFGTGLVMLDLDHNHLEEVDPHWLAPIAGSLEYLYLTSNRLQNIRENAFEGLTRLELVSLGTNQLREIPSRIFHPLTSLRGVYLNQNQLTRIDPLWFERNERLEYVTLYSNRIEDIPAFTFGNNPVLRQVDLGNNRLRLLHLDSFLPNVPQDFSMLMTDFNNIDYFDPDLFEALSNLNFLYLRDNRCISSNFYGVGGNRDETRARLQGCFDNFNRVNPINCIYVNAPNNYACYMTVTNIPGNDNAEVITGDHEGERGDADVTVVYMNFQVTRSIPSVICRQFPNLRELWADMSEIQTLNERSFADCANLQILVVEFDPITVVPSGVFIHNQNLNTLWFDFNNIHRIEPGAFTGTAISSLGLGDNNLNEFNRAWFDGIRGTLAEIYLYENRFSSVPSDAFDGLNALEYLDIGMNSQLTLPADIFSSLANPSILLQLRLDLTGISEIHPQWFTHLRNLQVLHLQGTQIRSIPDHVFEPLVSIQDLFLSQLPLRFFGIEAFGTNPLTSLSWLNLMSTELEAFDEEIFNRAENLEFLYLYNNPCVSINFYQVNLNRDSVREQLQQCFDNFVGSLRCQYIAISGYPYMCEIIINNVAGRDHFTTIGGDHVGSNTNADVRLLEGLAQRSRNLPTALCSTFTNVEEIFITNSEIEILSPNSFAGCSQLNRLTLAYNNIQILPANLFSSNSNLRWMSLGRNQISEIHESAFTGTQLRVLELADNRLNNFNPATFNPLSETLEILDLAINRIPEIPENGFSQLRALRDLDLSRNPGLILPSLVFSSLQSLRDLTINQIGIRSVDPEWFRSTRNLTYLSLSNNWIRRLPEGVFSSLVNLETLVLRSNNIDMLSVYNFGWEVKNIVSLIADENRINAVDIRLFDQLENLIYFYLRGNVCANINYFNIHTNREYVRERLMTCFENYGIDEPDHV